MAFPTGWLHKQKLTIDYTKVSGSANLTDFPVLLTGANFLSAAFDNTQGKEIYTNYLLNDANLVAYWRMEADGTDTTANNNDLTGVNTPTHATGKFGNGVALVEASNQYYKIVDASQTGLDLSTDFSFSAWVKFDGLGDYDFIISKDEVNGAGTRSYNFYKDASNRLVCDFFQADSTTRSYKVTTNTVTTGVWYHIVATADISAGVVKIYVDGVEWTGGGATLATSIANSAADFCIGARDNAAGVEYYFDGMIDDVAIFNRLLTATEIRSLYRGGIDLRFSSDEAGTTELCSEVVDWDIVADTAEVWVKIPTVSYTENTVFYVWYGSSSATPYARDATYGSENVWDANYKIVAHMRDYSPNTIEDSTTNEYIGTKIAVGKPVEANAKIGKGQDFTGTNNDYIYFNKASVASDQVGTVTFWATLDNYTDAGRAFSAGDEASTTRYVDTFYAMSGKAYYRCRNNDTEDRLRGNTALTDGATYFFAIKSDGSTISMFVNGTKQTLTADSGANNGRWFADVADIDNLTVGILKRSSLVTPLTGILDEMHYSNDDRTDGWIVTEYNNQSSPETFSIPSSVTLFGLLGNGIIPYNK